MTRLFDRGLIIACALALAALALNAALTFRTVTSLRNDANAVAETHSVLMAIETVVSLAKDAETGQRGYLITGEKSYLEPYERAIGAIDAQTQKLQGLVGDKPDLQALMDGFKGRLDAKREELRKSIEVYQSNGFEGARELVLSDRGKIAMDALRRDADSMIAIESDRRELLLKHAETNYRTSLLTSALGNLFGFGMVGGFILLLRRNMHVRAQAAELLFDERERFRTTLASIGDAVVTTDAQGRVTYLNAVAESLTGWRQAEAAGEPLVRVFNIVNEQSRQTVENPAERVLREGVIVGLANHTILIAKDGVERPIDDSAAPIRDQGGEIFGVVLVFRDVTARQQTEQALRAAEQQFRTLADTIPQLAWMAEPDGHIFWYNQRWFDYTGTTLDEMKGWGWQSVHDPAELPRVLEKFKAAITATSDSWEDTFPLRRHDGAMRWHLTRMLPLRDDQGRVVRWFGTNTDVTEQQDVANELRRLAADLSEADRRKDVFLATLAHELRNPLAPIRNAVSILKASRDDLDAFESTREMLDRQVQQMVRLIDDLLDLSRITRNRIELRRETVALTDVVAQAVESCRPSIVESGHALAIDLPATPVMLYADSMRLAQIFANLLQNACKYTEPGGRLSVSAVVEEDEVVVTFRDNGIGIPPEMLGRIFEMFTQVEPSQDRAQGGLGIGLTLVKRLVEMHGGRVEARSAGIGEGSEFSVRLPVDSGAPVERRPLTNGNQAAETKRRILVVDDNRDSAMSLVMLLNLSGHETTAAYDGLEAVAAAESFRPEVVLLDLGLPKLNGYEAARQIRKHAWGRDMVIVALTGWGQDEDRRKTAEFGFDHHFVKPVEHAELIRFLSGLDAGR